MTAQSKDGPSPKFFMLPTQSVRSSVTSIVPERIGEILREQIKQDVRVELMPGYEEIQKGLGGSTAAIAQAESLYTSGIGLLTAGEDKQAAENFQRAVDIMEQNLGDLTNYDILADALANLALAYFNSDFDLDARKRMQQYAQMRPGQTLDKDRFPKDLIAIYEEEAKKVKSAGPGKLKVDAKGKPAMVFVDGVEKGNAPATIDDVGFGSHYLVVRGTDGSVWADVIRVKGRGKSQEFSADLAKGSGPKKGEGPPAFYTDLLEKIETGTFGTDLAPYLKELTSQTGAAYVAWVVMYKKSGEYVAAPFAYRASDGMIVQGDDVTFNIELSNLLVGVSTLSKSLVDLALQMPQSRAVTTVQLGGPPPKEVVTTTTTTDTTATSDTTVTIKEPSEPPPSQARSTWTYVGVAAGGLVLVGLVAGGIYLLSEDGTTAPGFNTEVSW